MTRIRNGFTVRWTRLLALAGIVAVAAHAARAFAAGDAEPFAPAPSSAVDPVARACPCSGPAVGGIWRNHGQYLACVTKAARQQARTTALSASEARLLVRERARSSCGKVGPDPGNVRVCAKNPVLPCPTVRTARVDDCAECTAALAGELVQCARVVGAGGRRSDVCSATARIRARAGRIVEQRTGIDCASCEAKLGTPPADGLDCVVAACDAAL